MKRHQLLMLEWNIDSMGPKQLQEIETAYGAAGGATAGALGSAGIWAYKRLKLRKQMQQCPDEACKEQVQKKIVDLRNKALKMGAAATAGGAALGFGGSAYANALDKQNTINDIKYSNKLLKMRDGVLGRISSKDVEERIQRNQKDLEDERDRNPFIK